VILVSDHGHVQDDRTVCTSHEGGDRWREFQEPILSGEIALSGERVALAAHQTLIAPWSERIRYGMKKNGYHGGVNPQEALIPWAIVCPPDRIPTGWNEMAYRMPVWWDEAYSSESQDTESHPQSVPPKVEQKRFSKPFFDQPWNQVTVATGEGTEKSIQWIEALVDSALFVQQKRYAGRSVPEESLIKGFLKCLNDRGGKMTGTALARALDYPPFRLRGLMAVMQRLLNVDGYAVLSRDDSTDTIEFNKELLFLQFGISGELQ
jgi:hypothetical protein